MIEEPTLFSQLVTDFLVLLTEPWSLGFFQRAMMAGMLAGIAGGLLSGFVVWRRMAFLGDAMAHVILPGIVIAHILGINLLIGALVSSLLAVTGMGTIAKHRSVGEDSAIGIVFVGFFALGILLLSGFSTFQDLSHILFGSILGVSTFDLLIMLILVILLAVGIILFYKELLVTSFDPSHSVAIGLNPDLIRLGLLIAIALTTVVTIQSVGVVLVLALLITPGATASFFTRQLHWIIIIGILMAMGSTLVGFYLSYWLDLPSGASIVLVLFVLFLVCMGIHRLQELLIKRKRLPDQPSSQS